MGKSYGTVKMRSRPPFGSWIRSALAPVIRGPTWQKGTLPEQAPKEGSGLCVSRGLIPLPVFVCSASRTEYEPNE